jgi:hypothetical protein
VEVVVVDVEVVVVDVELLSVGAGSVECVVSVFCAVSVRGVVLSDGRGNLRLGSPTVPVVSGPLLPEAIGAVVVRGRVIGGWVGRAPATVPGGAVDMLPGVVPGSVKFEVVSTFVLVTPILLVPTVLVLVPIPVEVPLACPSCTTSYCCWLRCWIGWSRWQAAASVAQARTQAKIGRIGRLI